MPPWSQGPGGGRTSAVGILGNVCSCMKELETNQPRSEAGRQGKPWFMYQHILSNIGIMEFEGITCYLLAEKEEKGRHKGRKNYSLMQLVSTWTPWVHRRRPHRLPPAREISQTWWGRWMKVFKCSMEEHTTEFSLLQERWGWCELTAGSGRPGEADSSLCWMERGGLQHIAAQKNKD